MDQDLTHMCNYYWIKKKFNSTHMNEGDYIGDYINTM